MKRMVFAPLVVGLLACEAQVDDMIAELPELAAAPAGAVEASFRVGPVTDGMQTVWVRLTGYEGQVGSYQGSISFDASQFGLVSATATDAEGTGEFAVLNEEEAARGHIRFAGFSVEGFEVRDVIELRFRTQRPFESGEIEVALDVVGTAEGAEVAEEDLAVAPAMQPMVKLELGR